MAKEETNKASQEDIQAALALLAKTREQRAKQREKMKSDPVAKAKAEERAKRLRVKNSVLVRKALAAGIVVTEDEIQKELAKG
jgi:FKBP-type peptidyl-prolyl cis-trans isomerase (trigger factor)